MTFDKIVFQPTQPGRTDTAWAKPVKGGFALYLPFNGRWQPQVLVDSMGTDTPDDDETTDISNIPEIVKEVIPEVIGDSVEQEVTRQIEGHDLNVRDTHNTDSADAKEYDDVSDVF